MEKRLILGLEQRKYKTILEHLVPESEAVLRNDGDIAERFRMQPEGALMGPNLGNLSTRINNNRTSSSGQDGVAPFVLQLKTPVPNTVNKGT